MSQVKLYPPKPSRQAVDNLLPQTIQTPSGLALLELQGTINLPEDAVDSDGKATKSIPVGRIDFPDYHPDTQEAGSTAWMKRVYLYVGPHQRLTGEVKKLPKAIAIVRKKDGASNGPDGEEQLEVAEIVKYKLVFSHRPEPVNTEIY
ncbi:Chromosome transmission fidelity protein 8 like [Verticillium longisporum]|nr:Chromosome transmission fidelity protein 8 like [Verticillium longisporum]